jgi:dGTPase
MKFENIFTEKRVGSDKPSSGTRSGFQRDFDRLIFSSAFRRLQNKTQVFPLPGTAFVHNRLTHSLEVASVGRSLGK